MLKERVARRFQQYQHKRFRFCVLMIVINDDVPVEQRITNTLPLLNQPDVTHPIVPPFEHTHELNVILS